MSRFVLLRHECPPGFEKPSHWDFMLEWQGVLRTWELRELPTAWVNVLGEKTGDASITTESSARTTVEAFSLPDHRLAYLDFEGSISQGRGEVACCDRGTYLLETALLETALFETTTPTQLTLRLVGEFLCEPVCLRQLTSQWELSCFAE